MAEENSAVSIDQKVAAGLKNIIAAVRRPLHAAAKQLKVAHQGRPGKNLKAREALQAEGAIRLALRIGKERERPASLFLVRREHTRLSEGNHQDGNAAALELGFSFRHLTEVRLAGQSGEMAEKDQQG